MLLHNRQQFQRHSARPLGFGLPFLHDRLAGVEIAREHRLADLVGFAQAPDVARGEFGEGGEAGFVAIAHRRLWPTHLDGRR